MFAICCLKYLYQMHCPVSTIQNCRIYIKFCSQRTCAFSFLWGVNFSELNHLFLLFTPRWAICQNSATFTTSMEFLCGYHLFHFPSRHINISSTICPLSNPLNRLWKDLWVEVKKIMHAPYQRFSDPRILRWRSQIHCNGTAVILLPVWLDGSRFKNWRMVNGGL